MTKSNGKKTAEKHRWLKIEKDKGGVEKKHYLIICVSKIVILKF